MFDEQGSVSQSTPDIESPILIDEKRYMRIPRGMILGVTSDDRVKAVRFRFGRYVAGEDLSAYDARINIINANGEADIYTITDLAPAADDENYVECSWLISRHVAEAAGTVQFNLCLRKIDAATAEITNEWNSRPARMIIRQGLEVDSEIISNELSDWATALIIQLSEIEMAAEKAIADSRDGVIDAIEQKGAETLAEILAGLPDDYTELSDKVNNIGLNVENGALCLTWEE